MAVIDAYTNFSTNEVSEMEELVRINEEMKKLDSRKKVLSENVKRYMTKANIDKVDVSGSTFSIVESTRRTISKTEKDKFIADLVGMGKKHLVTYSIEPDLDSIFAEVDAGSLQKDFVDKYVKVTPVTSLRCNV